MRHYQASGRPLIIIETNIGRVEAGPRAGTAMAEARCSGLGLTVSWGALGNLGNVTERGKSEN